MGGDDYLIYGLCAVAGVLALVGTLGQGAAWGAEPTIGLGLLLLGLGGLLSSLLGPGA